MLNQTGTFDDPVIINERDVHRIAFGVAYLVLHYYDGKMLGIQVYDPHFKLNDNQIISTMVGGNPQLPGYIRINDTVYMRRVVSWYNKSLNIAIASFTDYYIGDLKPHLF